MRPLAGQQRCPVAGAAAGIEHAPACGQRGGPRVAGHVLGLQHAPRHSLCIEAFDVHGDGHVDTFVALGCPRAQPAAILVTGGAGFVGANLAIALAERHPDAEIVAL